jgi:hypothetical protein
LLQAHTSKLTQCENESQHPKLILDAKVKASNNYDTFTGLEGVVHPQVISFSNMNTKFLFGYTTPGNLMVQVLDSNIENLFKINNLCSSCHEREDNHSYLPINSTKVATSTFSKCFFSKREDILKLFCTKIK